MKKIYITLLIVLGFLFKSNTVLACGSAKQDQCCKKEITTSAKEKKSCCKSSNDTSKEEKGCKEENKHSKCCCSPTSQIFSIHFVAQTSLLDVIPNFSSVRKVTFSYISPSLSEGFYSIWLIPKIS
ncbi:MAG: hypothetical protein QM535_11550 [Limnohabitans sp.]|nr:hypothetical protein [Limnohabitans sp.]